MKLSVNPDVLKRFRRTPWKFEQTFSTPLRQIPEFVEAILSTCAGLEGGSVTIDRIVFEPKHIVSILPGDSNAKALERGMTLTADTADEVSSLLRAALADWVDFVFFSVPKSVVIYADHDEYTTFYANSHSNLDRIKAALSQRQFKSIESYTRHF